MQFPYVMIPLVCVISFLAFAKIITTFLFYPAKPVNMAGTELRGLVPSKLPFLIAQLKTEALKAFPSFDELEENLIDGKNTSGILELADGHIDHFLRNKLKEKIPMVSMFIGDKTIAQLKNVFMEELEQLFPTVMKSYTSGLKNKFDPESMINKAMGSDMEDKILLVLKNEIKKSTPPFMIFATFFGFGTGLFADFLLYLSQ